MISKISFTHEILWSSGKDWKWDRDARLTSRGCWGIGSGGGCQKEQIWAQHRTWKNCSMYWVQEIQGSHQRWEENPPSSWTGSTPRREFYAEVDCQPAAAMLTKQDWSVQMVLKLGCAVAFEESIVLSDGDRKHIVVKIWANSKCQRCCQGRIQAGSNKPKGWEHDQKVVL